MGRRQVTKAVMPKVRIVGQPWKPFPSIRHLRAGQFLVKWRDRDGFMQDFEFTTVEEVQEYITRIMDADHGFIHYEISEG